MGRPANQDRIEVREGVYLYLRDSPIWQVYFKLKGAKKAVRRSLGTRNLAEAKRLALEEYDQARLRQMSGKPELGISFSKLCDEYLASLPEGGSKSYHDDTIRRHMAPFFVQNVPDFSEITNADVLDYIQWRRQKGIDARKEPKPETLNRENVVLSGLIKFAVTRGYLPKADAPDVKALKTANERRPNFTRPELKKLLKTAKARIDEVTNAATKEQRRLLYDWIGVMANTGLRPAEAHALTWANVHLDDEPYLHIKRGKTKPRDVVPLDPAVGHLKAIRERQREFLTSCKKELKGTHHVFSLPDRNKKTIVPVKGFKTAFNNLVKACKFDDRGTGLGWVQYSLRHSYATMRIEDGTNIYVLKDQMGTSVRMIEQHYGHVITREQRLELTKTKDNQQPTADMAAINEKFDEVVEALREDKKETLEQIGRRYILQRWEEEHGHPPHKEDEEIVDGLVYLWIKHDGKDPFVP
jgi:integrase